MTFGAERHNSFSIYDHQRLPPNALEQKALGGAVLVSVAALCAWTFCSNFPGTSADQIDLAGARSDRLDLAATLDDRLEALNLNSPASNVYASLFDARFSLGGSPGSFASITPPRQDGNQPVASPLFSLATRNTQASLPTPSPSERIAQNVVLPAPRPASAPTRIASLADSTAPVTLAYATSDDGSLGVGQIAEGRYDQWTAVYDISAHTVYMPDGTRLEAHSGFGSLLDDPRHPDEKMYGVTPPNVYDLEVREELFHGVRALRLIPEDSHKVFGRAGPLAHSFMLGPKGDSNGCVSFRNYDAFLQAYLDQKVKRLAVVTSL
jgi:Protein of unknown function (DUF2778)